MAHTLLDCKRMWEGMGTMPNIPYAESATVLADALEELGFIDHANYVRWLEGHKDVQGPTRDSLCLYELWHNL